MKCIPITCAGRFVAAAIFVTEMEEVFVARILPAGTTSSSFRKRESFSSSRSVAASTTRSQEANPARSVVVRRPESARSFSCAVIFSLRTRMSSPFPIPARERARTASDTSFRTTCSPLMRETCAIPLPIWPAPRTPIFETLIPIPHSNRFING